MQVVSSKQICKLTPRLVSLKHYDSPEKGVCMDVHFKDCTLLGEKTTEEYI